MKTKTRYERLGSPYASPGGRKYSRLGGNTGDLKAPEIIIEEEEEEAALGARETGRLGGNYDVN